jgi:hypothetical protein
MAVILVVAGREGDDELSVPAGRDLRSRIGTIVERQIGVRQRHHRDERVREIVGLGDGDAASSRKGKPERAVRRERSRRLGRTTKLRTIAGRPWRPVMLVRRLRIRFRAQSEKHGKRQPWQETAHDVCHQNLILKPAK